MKYFYNGVLSQRSAFAEEDP